jgi:hypothetical protein
LKKKQRPQQHQIRIFELIRILILVSAHFTIQQSRLHQSKLDNVLFNRTKFQFQTHNLGLKLLILIFSIQLAVQRCTKMQPYSAVCVVCCVVRGVWCVVRGVWCVVRGVWCVVWYVVRGVVCVVV